jgi:uncharacterized protein (TIGR02646 family)
MRKITKDNPLPSFESFKKKNPSANWDDFHYIAQDVYNETREQILIIEQNCMCGYTEIPIEESIDVHLDHYKKKGMYPALTFDWDNLIAATYDDDFGANYKDGKFKIKETDYPLIFNPVMENVENYFEYTIRGEIEPKSDISPVLKSKAQKTIEVFNLTHDTLRNRRETIIKQINEYGDLSSEEIKAAMSSTGFCSVIEQYLHGK